jgi:cell division septation protein DedD
MENTHDDGRGGFGGEAHVFEEKKERCTKCTFVLIFAAVVFVAVGSFVLFSSVRRPAPSLSETLPAAKAPPLPPEEYDARMLELGELIHPELASTSESVTTLSATPSLP